MASVGSRSAAVLSSPTAASALVLSLGQPRGSGAEQHRMLEPQAGEGQPGISGVYQGHTGTGGCRWMTSSLCLEAPLSRPRDGVLRLCAWDGPDQDWELRHSKRRPQEAHSGSGIRGLHCVHPAPRSTPCLLSSQSATPVCCTDAAFTELVGPMARIRLSALHNGKASP